MGEILSAERGSPMFMSEAKPTGLSLALFAPSTNDLFFSVSLP